MKLLLLTAAAVAVMILAAPAGASGITKHDRDVLRFFQHHPRLASTPTGGRVLSKLLPRLAAELRSLQAARAARLAVPQTWLDSVEYVGRYFGADVAAWEKSCSQPGSEGGWGRWVPNTQGSGAGGWLQFIQGTFDGIIDRAIAHARQLGMPVSSAARSWYSPLGQAVAGAQMLLDGRRGEWTGAGC